VGKGTGKMSVKRLVSDRWSKFRNTELNTADILRIAKRVDFKYSHHKNNKKACEVCIYFDLDIPPWVYF
jgi:hypothetical protein